MTGFDELDQDAVETVSILVVDDLPEKLLVIETILEDLGQKLVVARSGAEALREVLKQEFAVILLDVNMPGMDGLETARLIRTHRRLAHTPIIFVTAYVDEMQTAQGYSLGAVDYILSPVVPEVLRSKVRVFVELHIGQRRLRAQARERIALVAAEAAQKAAEASTHRSNFLAHASRVLASSLEVEVGMQRLLELVVPEVAAKAVLCLFADARGEARVMQCEATDAGVPVIGGRALGEGGLDQLPAAVQNAVVDLGRSIRVIELPDSEPAATRYTLGEHTLLPMSASGQALGALVIEGPRDSLDWTLVDELANRAAMALENARLYRSLQVEIDERRQAQQKLLDINQRKDEFLAMLSHELRNPLAPIRNAVEVIRRLTPDADHRVAWANDVTERQVNQLTRLVEELLDVARISQGKIALRVEAIDLCAVVAQAVETVRGLIDKRHHHLTLVLPQQPLMLQGDFTRLSQVVANLLNNAAKYTEDQGEIGLSLTVEGERAVIKIKDNGMGIDAELLPHVFELFEQGKRSLDRSQGGLGVGLTLVHRLVDLHHGEVTASSAGSGQGSEFRVMLPGLLVEQAQLGPASSQDADADDATTVEGCRVLVVDDQPDIAQTLGAYLELAGCQVRAASDGLQALATAAEFFPDVVLLDIGLPEMDGYEVARRLRRQPELADSLLIALTGYGQAGDRLQAKEAGFNEHIVKPADPQMVEQMIAEWWAQREASLPPPAPQALAG